MEQEASLYNVLILSILFLESEAHFETAVKKKVWKLTDYEHPKMQNELVYGCVWVHIHELGCEVFTKA